MRCRAGPDPVSNRTARHPPGNGPEIRTGPGHQHRHLCRDRVVPGAQEFTAVKAATARDLTAGRSLPRSWHLLPLPAGHNAGPPIAEWEWDGCRFQGRKTPVRRDRTGVTTPPSPVRPSRSAGSAPGARAAKTVPAVVVRIGVGRLGRSPAPDPDGSRGAGDGRRRGARVTAPSRVSSGSGPTSASTPGSRAGAFSCARRHRRMRTSPVPAGPVRAVRGPWRS